MAPSWTRTRAQAAVVVGAWLAGAGLVAAQDGTITVIAPSSDDLIYAGGSFSVLFETSGGVASPYNIDLYRGSDQVASWCSDSEGCDIDDGKVLVSTTNSMTVGDGYTVRVMERSSSIFGTSDMFEILKPLSTPAPASSSSEGAASKFEDVGGNANTVGDMNLAMIIVASICGVALVGTFMAACLLIRRRSRHVGKSVQDSTGDIENRGDRSYGRGSTRDKSPTPSPTYDRSFKGGVSLRGGPSLMSSHPLSRSPSAARDGDLDKFRSPGKSIVRGDQQRSSNSSRERSRSRSPPDEDSRPRMYSGSTPGRERNRPVMISTTPGRRTPGRARTPGKHTSGTRSSGGSSRENSSRRLYPAPTRDWSDEEDRHRGRDRRPRSQVMEPTERQMLSGRSLAEEAFSAPPRSSSSRSGSHGEQVRGYRRSLSVGRDLSRSHDTGDWEEEVLRRRVERGMMPMSSELRRSRDGDRAHRPRSSERRSKSAFGRLSRDMLSPDQFAMENGHELDGNGYLSGNGGRRHMEPSPSSRHSPRRSGLSVGGDRPRGARRRSKSPRAISSSRELVTADKYEADRAGYAHGRSRSDRSWGFEKHSFSPASSRHSPHRSGMAIASPQDVSWEELRSKHHRNRERGANGGPLPTYSEIAAISPASLGSRSVESSSNSHRRAPPSYSHALTTPTGGHLSIGVPSESRTGSFKGAQTARSARSSKSSRPKSARSKRPISRAHSNNEPSPGTRAVSARRAARDAQESAERALAAAAAASRAADLAAQAAIEAEAEANADGMLGAEGGDDDTPVGSYSPPEQRSSVASGSSARDKKGFGSGYGSGAGSARTGSGRGSTRAWSGIDDEEAKERAERAERSAVMAEEALAVMGRSGSSGPRTDHSWLSGRTGGPDTAGGSGSGRVRSNGEERRAANSQGRRQQAGRPPSGYRSNEELAVKRRNFVKQYSGTSTYDGESDYSVHENPSVASARRSYLSQDSGLTSFDESDFSFRGERRQAEGEKRQAEDVLYKPQRPRSPVDDGSGSAARDRTGAVAKRRESPARLPSFQPRARTRDGVPEVAPSSTIKNISEAGSAPEDAIARER